MSIHSDELVFIMAEVSIQEQLMQLRRNQILDAAVSVIAERGFERTTIKQIAKQAGVADGTIYNYFKNKAAIMTAIVARMTQQERRDLDFAQAAEMDFASFLGTYIPQRFQEMEAEMPALKVVMAETLNNAEFRDRLNAEIYQPLFMLAEQYVQQLIERESMPTDDAALLTRLIASPVFGLLMLRLMGDEYTAENWAACGQALSRLVLELVQP